MRVNHVEHARKAPGPCGKCGTAIEIGSPYLWLKPRYGSKRIRCGKPECRFKPSETISNDKESALLAACENAEHLIESWDGVDAQNLRDILSEAAEGVREVAAQYRDSAQNIEDGFQHATSQSDEFNARADDIDAFADDLESAGIEDFDGEDGEEDSDEQREEWADEQRANALAALENRPA